MANLAGKVEGEIEIKADANEFFHCFGGKAHRMPDLCPGKVHSVDVHEGDGKTEGSVKLWTYTHDGKVETFKERLKVDEENKTLTVEGIEGDAMKIYKNYKITLQIVTKDQSNFVKFTIDYEKMNEDVPNPTPYLEWLINTAKHLDESLLKA